MCLSGLLSYMVLFRISRPLNGTTQRFQSACPPLLARVVLRAANQNLNDCRGQSYLNLWVGEGFAVPGTIWYNPGRIRTIQMFRFYEFAQPFMLSYLVPRIPTLPSPCKQWEALNLQLVPFN